MSLGPHLFLALLEGTVTALVLALTALGLSLVFGVMRIVNIAHGEFFMLGAVLAWWFGSAVGGSPLVGFLIALIAGPLVVGGVALAALPIDLVHAGARLIRLVEAREAGAIRDRA